MKKTYEKPGLLVESFALSQSIANSCGIGANNTTLGTPNYTSPSTCAWQIGGDAIWIGTHTKCTDFADENADVNGNCYNNPTHSFQLFAS